MGDQVVGGAGEPGSQLHVMLDRRHPGGIPAAASADRVDLLRGQPRHKAQRREHLHMLFVERLQFAQRLLLRLGQIKRDADRQILAELQIVAHVVRHSLIGLDRPLRHDRGATADQPLDAVAHHEFDAAPAGADDRLPAFDRHVDRTWHQGQFLQLIAAIGDLGRQRVVLALMREGLVVEGLEEDLDLLLEQFAVGVLVDDRRAEGLDLAAVVAAADAEYGAPLGQDVGRRVILGEAQRMPHRCDVEAAADPQPLCDMRQMHRAHQDVRQALVAFGLEMVLGQPQRVVAELVHHLGDRFGLVEDRGELVVRIAPLVGRSGVLTMVGDVDVAGVDRHELVDHPFVLS